jgi:hypothetical protein
MTKCVLSFCVLLLIGCSTFATRKQQEQFEIASHVYEQALFLGKYEVANGFRKEQTSENKTLNFERLKKIKVTSYELRAIKVSKDQSLVNQTVEIKYYHLDYLIEKTITDKQRWKYNSAEKRWYLQSGLPDF